MLTAKVCPSGVQGFDLVGFNSLVGEVIMVDRGGCRFTAKANNAQAAGASAVLVINNQKELYKMVCEPDETDLNIDIPAIMLPPGCWCDLGENAID